jgi:predicted O-methyltransferase YrrM
MKLSNLFCPPPYKARHYKRTFVASPEDEASQPSRAVIEFALDAVRRTLDVDVASVCERMPHAKWSPGTWPGEHYRLLAGMVAHLCPRTVIEIGTLSGISALSLLKYLPADGSLVTFDIIPWKKIPDTCLRDMDFADGHLRQVIADLADPVQFQAHAPLLAKADLLFVDGPKDNKFEPAFAANLNTIAFEKAPWVVFDDIRDRNMLRFWRELDKPKLDLSSFGHWTGTGLVRWESA